MYKDDPNRPISEFREGSAAHRVRDFTKGLVLCGSNPAFLLFWVYVATTLEKYGIEAVSFGKIVWVLVGIVIGDLLWFSLFIKLLKMGAERLKGKLIRGVRVAISFFLIVLGLSTVVVSIFGGGT